MNNLLKGRTPYYGKTGLNAGIMLYNLTRLEEFPNTFYKSWSHAYRSMKIVNLADQDILNALFSKVNKNIYCIQSY